jgi:hypothetical protein
MTVRREIAEPRRETGVRRSGDWLRRLRRCLSRCVQTGTGANMKGASPQPYGEGPMGEPTGRQVRRHRACEVERPLNAPGAKKKYRNEF